MDIELYNISLRLTIALPLHIQTSFWSSVSEHSFTSEQNHEQSIQKTALIAIWLTAPLKQIKKLSTAVSNSTEQPVNSSIYSVQGYELLWFTLTEVINGSLCPEVSSLKTASLRESIRLVSREWSFSNTAAGFLRHSQNLSHDSTDCRGHMDHDKIVASK